MTDTMRWPGVVEMPEPLHRPLSTMLAPTLEPIPGSAAPTPSARESPDPPTSDAQTQPEAGPSSLEITDAMKDLSLSRNSSMSKHMPGSYFAQAPEDPAPQSGSTTPGGRTLPAIEIPAHTPDQPLFSSYPQHPQSHPPGDVPQPSRSNSKGKRPFSFPLKAPFQFTPVRRHRESKDSSASDDGGSQASDDDSRWGGARRRSSSLSQGKVSQPPSPARPAKSIFRRHRAGSLGARYAPEYHVEDEESWKQMAKAELDRLQLKAPQQPFSYQQPGDSGYTLQSVSTLATVRPLASPSISISPRKSSLVGSTPTAETPASPVVITDDMVMPHGPPPRRSSLDMTAMIKDKDADLPPIPVLTDVRSVPSSSVTCTENSLFSPSTSSQEHPLSSASTSLSRSAKSAKEGTDERDAALTAVKLQRSLEWEAKQTKRRRRLDKRTMVVLELVETEVAYAEGLRALVQVYLPQLAALPSVSERTATLIARNAVDLLDFHANFATKMVQVLKEEKIGYEILHDPDVPIERAARRLSALFVEHVRPTRCHLSLHETDANLGVQEAMFAHYKQFCAGSIAAATLVRHVSMRLDYDSFERRCQFISSSQPHITLKDLLLEEPASVTPSNRSRLHFRDFLIMPIQRICRYPLLLGQLKNTALTPSVEMPDSDEDDEPDIGIDVDTALDVMRRVAGEADEARRVKEAEVKSATILERLEPHIALTPTFIKSLGTCRLIGSLDVLYHHPTIAPLVPPVKVKYLAAFLYRGYLILAKVKKGKAYEAKHFLPLEVFEMIDITEGFLPHSVRLTLRDHNFDLAASCEAEKDVWSAALCEARDEGVVPPFELPASVSPFAARSRRMSNVPLPDLSIMDVSKRHTLAVAPSEAEVAAAGAAESDTASQGTQPVPIFDSTPVSSPIRASFGSLPRVPNTTSTILLRRPSGNARLSVDRGLFDVFSESCAQARSKAQLHQTLFLPDMPSSELRDRMTIRDSTMLRRRKSFLDHKSSSFDIAFNGEVRGSVMPVRQTKSHHGRARGSRVRRGSLGGNESATEVGYSADETATSDFGGPHHHRRAQSGMVPRPPTASSAALAQAHRYSMSDFEHSRPSSVDLIPNRSSGYQTLPSRARAHHAPSLNRRKTASSTNLKNSPAPPRTRSMPVSPSESPSLSEVPPPVPPKPYSYSADRAAYSRNVSYFPINTDVETAGLGLIQSSVESERPKWQTLKRSMSFLRTTRVDDVTSTNSPSSYFPSTESLARPASLIGNASASSFNFGAMVSLQQGASGSASGSGSGSSTDELHLQQQRQQQRSKSAGSVSSTPNMPSQSLSGNEDEVIANPGGSAPNTPKRKKSVLLTRLRGFTPM